MNILDILLYYANNLTFLLRYHTSRYLLIAGIFMMPKGAYKREFIKRVYMLKEETVAQQKRRLED